jgi:hypothetical protein
MNLSGVLQGPEFRTEYRMTAAGLPQCVLRLAYPRVGNDTPDLGLAVPGAAVGYRAQWDADELRTVTFAVGDLPQDAPEGTPRPVAIQTRPQPDLPRLDEVDDWPGTVLQSTLVERAQTMAERQAAPSLNMTASPPEELPDITTYGPGDTVTLRVVTPLIPEGLEVAGRLSQVEVNAAAGVATWSVIGASPGPVVRETVNDRLTRIDSTLAQVFHGGQLAEVGGPPVIRDTLSGRVVSGNWTKVVGPNWERISDYAIMRANPPTGAAVVLEAKGVVEWRQQNLYLALSWPGGPSAHTALCIIEGSSVPFNILFAISITATAVVTGPGRVRGHLSATLSPMAAGVPPNMAHGSNTFAVEGISEDPENFTQANQTSFNLVARFNATAAGQTVQMTTTKTTYYGGAAP